MDLRAVIEEQGSESRARRICMVVDGYFDEFGVFRTTHRKSGPFYMKYHNLDPASLDQPRNHNAIGFVPAGGEIAECAVPILKELQQLTKGFRARFRLNDGNVEEVICHAKMLSLSADMSAANVLAGCKGSGALLPCRFCLKPKSEYRGLYTHQISKDPR